MKMLQGWYSLRWDKTVTIQSSPPCASGEAWLSLGDRWSPFGLTKAQLPSTTRVPACDLAGPGLSCPGLEPAGVAASRLHQQ
jgi:hypothetical protein